VYTHSRGATVTKFTSVSLATLFVLIELSLNIFNLTLPVSADITNTRSDAWGTLELGSPNWLGGNGVNVYSNGGNAGYTSDIYASVATPSGNSVKSGMKWQCVELVNRLYLTKGWISATWHGNGNQLYANAPTSLVKEANGSVTYLNPGDVIGLDDGGAGHAGIVDSISGTSVSIVNQNTGAVYSSATFSKGKIVMNGWADYSVQGVIHAPTANPVIKDSSATIGETTSKKITKTILPDGTNQLYTVTPTGVYETYWKPGSGTGVNTWRVISQANVEQLLKHNLSDGTNQLYTVTPTGVYETYWKPGSGGGISTWKVNSLIGVVGLAKTILADGTNQLYTATANAIYENYWKLGSGSGVSLWQVIAFNGTSGLAKTILADGTNQLYSATSDGVYETYWKPGSGGGINTWRVNSFH
jgi:hypothetical protein